MHPGLIDQRFYIVNTIWRVTYSIIGCHVRDIHYPLSTKRSPYFTHMCLDKLKAPAECPLESTLSCSQSSPCSRVIRSRDPRDNSANQHTTAYITGTNEYLWCYIKTESRIICLVNLSTNGQSWNECCSFDESDISNWLLCISSQVVAIIYVSLFTQFQTPSNFSQPLRRKIWLFVRSSIEGY